MFPGVGGYSLRIRQHPEAARACGSADRPDRRPIDPVVILQLIKDRQTQIFADSITASFFCYATIASFNTNQSLASPQPPLASNLLTGTFISSVFYLKDPENGDQTGAFFVFSDLNVRAEGHYRLRFDLFGTRDNYVSPLAHCVSNPFTVYSAKRFPGMTNSTELSRSFADQGLKVRIRTDLRPRKRAREETSYHPVDAYNYDTTYSHPYYSYPPIPQDGTERYAVPYRVEGYHDQYYHSVPPRPPPPVLSQLDNRTTTLPSFGEAFSAYNPGYQDTHTHNDTITKHSNNER